MSYSVSAQIGRVFALGFPVLTVAVCQMIAQPVQIHNELESEKYLVDAYSSPLTIDGTRFASIEITPEKADVFYFGATFNKSYVDSNISNIGATPYFKSDALSLSSNYDFSLSDTWSGYATGNYEMMTGTTSQLSYGHSMIASAGASYAINPKLKFSFGLFSNTSLLNQSRAIPFIGIDWSITERLKLRTLNGAFLYYNVGDSTQVDLGVEYRDQILEVKNYQGTVFLQTDPYYALEESSIVGTLGVAHQWKDVFSIRAFAEYVESREFETEDPLPDFVAPKVKENLISFGVEGGIRF